jgi:hypothetical protein
MRILSLGRAGTAMVLGALTLLVIVNLGHPVHAATLVQLGSCSVDSIRGGVDWVGAIDGGCALSGIGALFVTASTVGLAFCAGWGVGRWLDGYIY